MEKKLSEQALNTRELDDEQLDEVSGGIGIQSIQAPVNTSGIKLGQALPKNTSFTKSDDVLPSIKGF